MISYLLPNDKINKQHSQTCHTSLWTESQYILNLKSCGAEFAGPFYHRWEKHKSKMWNLLVNIDFFIVVQNIELYDKTQAVSPTLYIWIPSYQLLICSAVEMSRFSSYFYASICCIIKQYPNKNNASYYKSDVFVI